jgi:hypothetical protein
VHTDEARRPMRSTLDAGFLTWSHIRILPAPAALPASALSNDDSMLHIVLNQAYNSRWSSSSCALSRGKSGNLVANCPAAALQSGTVDLRFFDPVSELGARVSLRALAAAGFAMPILGLMSLVSRRRTVAAADLA